MSRTFPRPTKVSAPFWSACHEQRFQMQRCGDCERFVWFPMYMCPHCAGMDLRWTELSGRGTVYSRSLVIDPVSAASAPPGPLMVALVELEEGPVMMTNIVGEGARDVAIGERVSILFQRVSDEVTMPVFERARGGA
jgi:uncharacterized OB-fold protein